MELHLSPEVEAGLARMAQHEGTTPEALLHSIARRAVTNDCTQAEILNQRLLQADQGVFIEDDEMESRFQQLLGA